MAKFVDPAEFVHNPVRHCAVCENTTPEARAFILTSPVVKQRKWKALCSWFSHPQGGAMPASLATPKRIERHFVECEGVFNE